MTPDSNVLIAASRDDHTHHKAAHDIPDAWLAACVIQHSEHLVTFDTVFKKLLMPGQLTLLNTK
jgi:predicted nucleic acid-binding protein